MILWNQNFGLWLAHELNCEPRFSTSTPRTRRPTSSRSTQSGIFYRGWVSPACLLRQTLESSVSAVSTPSICNEILIFQHFPDLQNLHTFAPLKPQNCRKKSSKRFAIFSEFSRKKHFSINFANGYAQVWWIVVGISRNVIDVAETGKHYRDLQNWQISWICKINFLKLFQINQKMVGRYAETLPLSAHWSSVARSTAQKIRKTW